MYCIMYEAFQRTNHYNRVTNHNGYDDDCCDYHTCILDLRIILIII